MIYPTGLIRDEATAVADQFGVVRWIVNLADVRDVEPVSLVTDEGLIVRMQLLRAEGYPA